MSGGDIPVVGRVLLVRLLAAPDKKERPGSLKKVKKHLAPLLGRWSGAELDALLARTVDELVARGLVQTSEGKAGSRFVELTDLGRKEALTFLGVGSLPAELKWPALRDRHLVRSVLGAGETKKPEQLKAAILAREYGLPGAPTLGQIKNALIWRQLGRESTDKVTAGALFQALVGERLAKLPGRTEPARIVDQLAAKAVGATRTATPQLRAGLLKRWIESTATPPSPAPTSVAPSTGEDLDLGTFARQALEAARAGRSGWFGENKVFIAHVWQRYRAAHGEALTEALFKERLAQANSEGLLELARADLVEAMDRGDVASSETSWFASTFHFVVVPSL